MGMEWRAIGALTSVSVDVGLEIFFPREKAEWMRWGHPLFGIEPLPPLDDWLVLGTSAAVFLAGYLTKRDTVRQFGEGMLLYSGPMIIHHMFRRAKDKGIIGKK